MSAEAAIAALRSAKRVLITSHASPDGDAIGSELALAELAENLGCAVVVANRDPAPANLSELPGLERIQLGPRLPAGFPGTFDLVAVLECPGLDRPGLDGLDRLPILNIDHHKANEGYGAVNWLDESAPAVGEMVWRMFAAAGVRPSSAAATNMMVALTTDTGDFRYDNATPRAFRAAAEMVEAGARPAEISEWVHAGRSAASVRLLGEALGTLELRVRGRLAVIHVGPDAFRRAGASPPDTDEIVNVPRSIAGVQVVAFLKQWQRDVVRVSLRSRGDVDVCAVASEHGGGGHTNAAGCTIAGDITAVREQLTSRLERLLEELR